jgi:hypothetical protein
MVDPVAVYFDVNLVVTVRFIDATSIPNLASEKYSRDAGD